MTWFRRLKAEPNGDCLFNAVATGLLVVNLQNLRVLQPKLIRNWAARLRHSVAEYVKHSRSHTVEGRVVPAVDNANLQVYGEDFLEGVGFGANYRYRNALARARNAKDVPGFRRAYAALISKPGVYGGPLEIVMLANLLPARIRVFQQKTRRALGTNVSSGELTEMMTAVPKNGNGRNYQGNKSDIYLLYDPSAKHYDAMIPYTRNLIPTPRPANRRAPVIANSYPKVYNKKYNLAPVQHYPPQIPATSWYPKIYY
jgi:hypothetical protein